MFLYKLIFSVIILIFGVAVSACFAGISMNRRSILSIVTFCVLDGLLQLTISTAFSDIFMKQLYPLITHLPLILLFVLVHKCSMINAIVSVLIGFICSQFPRWCSIFIQSFFDNIIIYAVIYVLSAALIFYPLHTCAECSWWHGDRCDLSCAEWFDSVPAPFFFKRKQRISSNVRVGFHYFGTERVSFCIARHIKNGCVGVCWPIAWL